MSGQGGASVVADAVLRGVGAGEEAGVGREGEGGVGEGAAEEDTAGGDGVDRGGGGRGVAIAAEAIGARRVEADHEQAHGATGELCRGGGAGLRAGALDEGQDEGHAASPRRAVHRG